MSTMTHIQMPTLVLLHHCRKPIASTCQPDLAFKVNYVANRFQGNLKECPDPNMSALCDEYQGVYDDRILLTDKDF